MLLLLLLPLLHPPMLKTCYFSKKNNSCTISEMANIPKKLSVRVRVKFQQLILMSICCLLCQGPLLAIYDLHSQFHSVYVRVHCQPFTTFTHSSIGILCFIMLGLGLAIYDLHTKVYHDLLYQGQGPLLDQRLCVKPPRLAA